MTVPRRRVAKMIRPEPKPISNEEDVHAPSNSWRSFPSRRPPTDSAGAGPSTCRTASRPADAYAALTGAGSYTAARTVPGTGEDLVADRAHRRRLERMIEGDDVASECDAGSPSSDGALPYPELLNLV
jgi:hypothetical protein